MRVNDAVGYGVKIEPVSDQSKPHWRAWRVVHLTPAVNRSRHHVFVDVGDGDGQRDRNPDLRIGWSWEGQRPDEYARPMPLDKPDDDLANGDVPINISQTLTVWITGDGLPSDRVTGIHTRHADERAAGGQIWNSMGHHSFFITFVKHSGDGPTRPPDGGNGSGGIEPGERELLIARMDALQVQLDLAVESMDRAITAFIQAWRGVGKEGGEG